MSKIEAYRQVLKGLEDWDPYLLQESRLPGPRANLELAYAVAMEGDERRFLGYLDYDELRAPVNSPEEFLAFCGVLGLGHSLAWAEGDYLPILRSSASDPRWRIREAVALGLQGYGRVDMEGLLDVAESWSEGTLLERRAVMAALCEPDLLSNPLQAKRVFDILDGITASILGATDRKSADFKVLRKGLAYGWSVAVAAQPDIGRERMARWVKEQDKDIRWIMKQNLKKKRLQGLDPAWVESQLTIFDQETPNI